MSKLTITALSSLILFTAFGTYALYLKPAAKNTSTYIWGKAQAPVHIRMTDKNINGHYITLVAEVKNHLSSHLDIQWELPEGVTLVEGRTTGEMNLPNKNGISTEEITLYIEDQVGADHVIFSAYNSRHNEKIGASAVYRLTDNSEQSKKTARIQEHMKAVGAKPFQ